MASFTERLGGALAGMPIDKEAELTPQQRGQVSQSYLNIAQALLAGATNNQSSGEVFANALGKAQAGYRASLQAQQTAELNNLKLEQARRANEAQKSLSAARKGAPSFSDFGGDYNQWAMASADWYFEKGMPEQATKFMGAFKPKTQAELGDFVFSESAKWQKQTEKLQQAYADYDAVKNLIATGSGGAAYAAMIKVIKALDDSVVRDSERAAFASSFGEVEGLKNKLTQATKGEITDVVGAEVLNIAGEAMRIVQNSYAGLANSRRPVYSKYYGDEVALDIIPEFGTRQIDRYSPQDFGILRASQGNLINNNYDEFN